MRGGPPGRRPPSVLRTVTLKVPAASWRVALLLWRDTSWCLPPYSRSETGCTNHLRNESCRDDRQPKSHREGWAGVPFQSSCPAPVPPAFPSAPWEAPRSLVPAPGMVPAALPAGIVIPGLRALEFRPVRDRAEPESSGPGAASDARRAQRPHGDVTVCVFDCLLRHV